MKYKVLKQIFDHKVGEIFEPIFEGDKVIGRIVYDTENTLMMDKADIDFFSKKLNYIEEVK